MNKKPKGKQNRIPSEITELGAHSTMHDNYTVQEQKYIFMLEVYDQATIREVIQQKAHHGDLNLSSFTRTDCCRRLEVPFKALEPCKSHYKLLEKALISIGNKPVELPYTVANPTDGKLKVQYKKMDYLFHYVRSIQKGQVRYAVIDIPFLVMLYANHIDLGYHKIKPKLFLALHHQSSRRLYQLAETRLKLGYTHFAPQELFHYLTTKAEFKGMGNMCYAQLDVATYELKNAYKLGMSDYYVAYRILYGHNDYIGKYSSGIEFSLHFRCEEMDQLSKDKQNELSSKRYSTKNLLIDYWKVEEWVADDISKKITPADYDAILQCFKIANARKAKGGVHNPAGLIVSMLRKTLDRS